MTNNVAEKRYQNITIGIDPTIHLAIKIMAIDEETTISNIMGEAVACWMKWMRKAELKDQKNEESKALAQERIKKAEELLAYAQAKTQARRKKKREMKHDAKMQAKYPYLDWKRAKNLPAYPKRAYNRTSNVPDADNVPGIQ